MTDPLFWLVLSLLFVTISLTIVLAVAIPALRELARAARSAEKLFDTLRREFPPTLESIRLTGLEISDLTEDVSEGVQSAGQVVKQVDQSLSGVRNQAQRVQSGTRSLTVGLKAAWRTLTRSQRPPQRRSTDRLPPSRPGMEFEPGNVSERQLTRRSTPEAMSLPQEIDEEILRPSSPASKKINGTAPTELDDLDALGAPDLEEPDDINRTSVYRNYKADDRTADDSSREPNRS